jgi:hypothetical protein
MKTNIEINAMKKHFLFFEDVSKNEENNNKYKTKIKKYNFYSKNEIIISNIVKQIPYFSNNYILLHDYDFINISKISEKSIEKIFLNSNQKYLLFKYNFNFNNLIEYNDFLYDFTCPKIFIFYIIETFARILKSLIQLNKNNICFYDLSPKKILFDMNSRENPMLYISFLSLHNAKLNEKYIINIIKKTKDFIHKPIEIHVLFYLIQNDIHTISYSLIEEITENFIKNLYILNLFSEKYKESYKNSCIETLKKYINKSKSYIIMDILKYHNTWDIYSLSIIYLHIIGNICRIFSLRSTFLNKIVIEFSKNIHPNPLKRDNLSNLLEVFEKLHESQNDWSFVNNIEKNNMQQLFAVLKS